MLGLHASKEATKSVRLARGDKVVTCPPSARFSGTTSHTTGPRKISMSAQEVPAVFLDFRYFHGARIADDGHPSRKGNSVM